jgi:integrase
MSRKNPIAKLPKGVHILKEGEGWRVRLGKKFTGGASVRKRFDTVADAREWIAAQVNQRSHIQATALSPEQLAEAKDAFTKLNGTSLSEAVRFYLLHAKPIGGIKPLSDVIEAVLASKKAAQLSQTHIKHLGWSLKKFAADFSKSNVNEIQQPQIEKWLNGKSYSHQTRLNYLRDLTLLFNFAITQGWTATNPAAAIQKSRRVDADVTALSPIEVSQLLKHCPENILPGAVIKIFSGLRTSELLSLDWAQVRETEIIVKGRNAKTRQRRVVTLSENLQAWLKSHRQDSGRVVPFIRRTWHLLLAQAASDAGVQLPMNVLRHTFGSYHYALHRHENLTAAEMGNSPAMVFRHYRAVVTPVASTKFWSLLPTPTENVVKFAA